MPDRDFAIPDPAGLGVLFTSSPRRHRESPGLGERGVGFHSLTEVIDTTTSAGRLLFGILASLAAFERDVIRERTMAGLAAARARGNLGGRPPIMTPEKLAVARQMLDAGPPKAVVAKTIGVSRPTLYAHLAEHTHG